MEKVVLPSIKSAAVCTTQPMPWLIAIFLISSEACGVRRVPFFHPMAPGDNWGRYGAINNHQVSASTATWDSAQDCLMV